jgi:hypothetical protein
MLPVSPGWAAAIRANHEPVVRADAYKGPTLLYANVPLASAEITKDAGQSPRTTATVTIASRDPTLLQILTVFGTRLKLFRGLRYPDGTSEVPLIADLDIIAASYDRPDNVLALELADPSVLVGLDTLTGPTTPNMWGASVNTAVEVIGRLLGRTQFHTAYPGRLDVSGVTDMNLAADYSIDGDPWQAIEQLADTLGAECYFTPTDRYAILRPAPSTKTTADAQLYAAEGGSVTRINSRLERSPNYVMVYGAADTTGKVRRGVAFDNAAGSPTSIRSAYGRVNLVVDRPTPFASQSAANAAAAALLRRVQGKVRSLTLDAVPDPALEPGDTVAVRFPSGAIERHVLQSVSIPFGPADTMTVTTRNTDYTTQGWP